MSLSVRVDGNGDLLIACGGAVCLADIRVTLGNGEESLRASPWEASGGTAAGGARSRFSRDLKDSAGPVAQLTVLCEDDLVWICVQAERTWSGLAVADSFETSGIAVPSFRTPRNLKALLVTYGLGRSGEGEIGGYWPEARCVAAGSLPTEAFAPIVLYDGQAALALAPASHFLTSALLRTEGGIARALHGAVDVVPSGTRLETVIAAGDSVEDALTRLGDALLSRSGKARPTPSDSALTSRLGWWNAYGSYYTEPIRPLDETRLVETLDRLSAASVPVAYVGLDLWYPYRTIGQALRFAPDALKYPRGFRELARQRDLTFVYHLSALAQGNEYAATGADPSFYAEVARELRGQGGIAAWHDWLRTQQHLTSALRSDPEAAERWFAGMGEALDHEGLKLLLCMQTMGMVLASTALPNAIGARTAIDYLFGQPEALETLASLGHAGFRNDITALASLRRQNLLVGSVLSSLGLLPFHDLFLTRHHEGLGGADPRIEAVLRALSCGPVGLGDGPGMTDSGLAASLLSAHGVVLRPDRAPYPMSDTLGSAVEVYRTEHVAGDERWEYVAALNASTRTASFAVPHDRAASVVWDVMAQRLVVSMESTIAAGQMAYYVVAPLRGGIAPIGLIDKLVPAPAGVLRTAEARDGWRLELDAPGERFAFACEDAPRVRTEDGRILPTQRGQGVWTVEIPKSGSWLVATRR